ncbi:MAG: NAD(P)/FAD-dependent oxidoreductase [Hyphomonas sp.]|uniref:geranylgeranyl reductase family protein n=1 Tax=Hyphomonas sp. TaxID=87 RepID=UPI003527FA1E
MTPEPGIDVLVIGLGPAGASAARAAASAGLKVVALDRKKAPGFPVQCAEFVPALISAGDATQVSRVQAISEMHTFVEAGGAEVTPEFPGTMIDRCQFDAHLVEGARNAGADIRMDCAVKAIHPDGRLELFSGETLTAKVLIGADGPHSLLGKATGHVNTDIIASRQVTVPLLQAHTATDIYLSERLPGGYGWLFPKGAVANVGLGVSQEHKDCLKPELEALLARLTAEGRIGEERLGHTGGAIPAGGMINPVAFLGDTLVLLAGDAAGLTNPVTGAGISAAVASGRMAGGAAADWIGGDASAADTYTEDLEDHFGASLQRAVKRRAAALAAHSAGAASPDSLRSGWIAYPQYWNTDDTREETHDLLEA